MSNHLTKAPLPDWVMRTRDLPETMWRIRFRDLSAHAVAVDFDTVGCVFRRVQLGTFEDEWKTIPILAIREIVKQPGGQEPPSEPTAKFSYKVGTVQFEKGDTEQAVELEFPALPSDYQVGAQAEIRFAVIIDPAGQFAELSESNNVSYAEYPVPVD